MAKSGLLESGPKAISLEDLNTEQQIEMPNQDGVVSEPQVQEQVETPPEPTPQAEAPVAEPESKEVVETPQEEPAKEPEKDTPQQFDFSQLNSSLNKNYESFEQIKADLEKPTMETEYQEAKARTEELQAKIDALNKDTELLLEQTDPTALFSTDALRLEVFKKQNPKKDAAIAQRVLSTEDLSSVDDLEMVKMGRKFKNTKLPGTDADLEAAIMEELNIEPDTPKSEWPNTAQIRLATMAGEYRDAFDNLKDSIILPEKPNLDELRAKRKQSEEEVAAALNDGWSKIAEEALKATDKIKIPVGEPKEGEEQRYFEWELRDAPKEDVDRLKQEMISLGIDPNSEEARGVFDRSLNLVLRDKNMSRMLDAYGKDLLARQKTEFLEKTNNTEPLKDSQRTEESTTEKIKKERTAFALGGLGPSQFGNKLF